MDNKYEEVRNRWEGFSDAELHTLWGCLNYYNMCEEEECELYYEIDHELDRRQKSDV